MTNPYKSEIRIMVQTDQYTVAPGGKIEIPLLISNEGSLTEQIRISVEGIPFVWVSAEQQVVLLQPGEQAQTMLDVHPPASPNARSGRYHLRINATSEIDPARITQTRVILTVAGFEVKGRVGVLMDGVQYSVIPGEELVIPTVLINQGLGADTFRLAFEDLPKGWTTIPEPEFRLQPGEVKDAVLIIQQPRDPSIRASRYPFRIQVASQEAPDQTISIDCILTVAAFTEFKSLLEAAQPDQNLPARVVVQSLSNIPVSFKVTWSSPENSLKFEPNEPQQINVPRGEIVDLEYTVQPTRRPVFGGEKSYPYTVDVQAVDQQSQTLEGSLIVKGLLPTWALVAGIVILILLCLFAAWSLWLGGILKGPPIDVTPTLTSTATVPVPTATRSQVDQRPLLIERKWYLVAYNDTRSIPGVQEAYTLFNPDGTLIGYTGCKDLSANYQTNFNQISIANLNLSRGTCPDTTLQQQEDALVAILRSARSYFVADTALQIASDAGFLNYSLTPVSRPEEISPPQAVIQVVPQAEAGQVVVFDGSASIGQAPLVSWKWDFGDGVTASGVVVQHVYVDAGTFTARLTVGDQWGQSGSTTQQIHILAKPIPTVQPTVPQPTLPPPPTAPPEQATPTPEPATSTPEPLPEPDPPQANINGPSQGYIGEPVVFDASASRPGSSPIVSYSWSFGNGQGLPASPEASVQTIYNHAGVYEVTVSVGDEKGLSSYATTRITIDARLETEVWTLTSINGKALLPGTAITLQFLQGQLTGYAGCNLYNGRYTAIDQGDGIFSIVIEGVSAGRRSCPADIMAQEDSYLAALGQVTSAAIEENMITMFSPTGNLVFYLIQTD